MSKTGFTTRRFYKISTMASTATLFITLGLWISGQFVGVGFNYKSINNVCCELDCAVGGIEFSVTRSDWQPTIIEHRHGLTLNNLWHSGLPRTGFYSYSVNKPPKIFAGFAFNHEYSPSTGLHSMDEPSENKVWYTKIIVPCWFLALIFAVAPALWIKNRRDYRLRDSTV